MTVVYGILWNYLLFTTVRCSELPHGQLIQYLAAKFREKKLDLSASGVASIIVSKHIDSVLLELVDNDDSNIYVSITTVSKRNFNETKIVEMDKKPSMKHNFRDN